MRPSPCSMPAARHASTCTTSSGTTSSSSHISTCGGTTATASSTPWAAAPSRLARPSTASRTVGGTVRAAAGQHLGDEERVARRLDVKLLGIDAVRDGELLDGAARERRQAQLRHARRGAELAHCETQRVRRLELILAIGDDDQRAERLGTPRQQSQMSSVASSAQCTSSITAIVGRRARSSSSSATKTACGFSPARTEASTPLRPPRRCRSAGPAAVASRERRTRPTARARAASRASQNAAHERALADAGLARDEHQPAAAGRRPRGSPPRPR